MRACPFPVGEDPLLRALAEELTRPETLAELEDCEREQRYPSAVLERLRALGLGRLFADEDLATSYHQSCLCLLAAHTTTSLAITLGVNSLALLAAHVGADAAQWEQIRARVGEGVFSSLLLTELEAGSELAATRARAEPGHLDAGGAFAPGAPVTHYRLSGRKELINGGTEHALLFTLLRHAPPEAPHGPSTHSLFWLERAPGLSPLPRWRTGPARAADISGVELQLTIEAGRRLGDEGQGLHLAQQTLAISRGGIASLATGTLARARQLTLDYARARRLYGAPLTKLGALHPHLLRHQDCC